MAFTDRPVKPDAADVDGWPLMPLRDAEAADCSWLAADRLSAGLTFVVVISIQNESSLEFFAAGATPRVEINDWNTDLTEGTD